MSVFASCQSFVIAALAGAIIINLSAWRFFFLRRRRLSDDQAKPRFSAIIDALPSPVYLKDLEGRYIDCNAAFAKSVFGLNKSEILGRTLQELRPPDPESDEESLYLAKDSELLSSPGTQQFESKVPFADGTLRDILFHRASINDSSGQCRGVVGVMVDVTDRRLAEEALRMSERQLQHSRAHLQAILDNAGAGIVLCNTAGHWIAANRRAAELLGYSLDDLLTAGTLGRVTHPDDVPVSARLFSDLVQGRIPAYRIEKRYVRKDGFIWWGEVSATPLRTTQGEVEGVVAILLDITARRSAEQTLRQSEENLRAIFNNAGAGIGVTNREGLYIKVNDRWAEMVGYTAQELLGKNPLDLTHPADKAAIRAGLQQLLEGKIPFYRAEHRFLRKNGEIFWADIAANPIYSPDGKVEAFVSILSDITARRGAMEALQQSEERYRTLYHSTPVMLHSIDRQGRIVSVSDFWLKSLGYTREEVVGRRSSEFLTEDSRRFAETVVLPEFFRTGVCRDVPYRFVRKDGKLIDVLLSAIAERDSSGAIVRSIAVLVDVTERRAAEQALELNQFSIDRVSDAAFRLEPDGRIKYVNETACRVLGYSRSELLEMHIGDINPHYQTSEWEQNWAELKQKGSITRETEHRTRDGRIFPVEVSANYLKYGDKEYEFAFVKDITERRFAEQERGRLESQLRESQKMEAVGQLAGGIAHDFNNVLSIILGNVALLNHTLQLTGVTDVNLGNQLAQIEHAAQRAATLTRQLLTFSRRKAAKTVEVDLNQVLLHMDRMLRQLLGEHIALSLGLHEGLPAVLADAGQLEQVVINLCINARDAMPRGGSLELTTSVHVLDQSLLSRHSEVPAGRYAALTVIDSGCGMNEDVLQHLFEPFFTTKPVGEGTGLGLATVYGIIKQFGGHVTVESMIGKGSSFKVYFPIRAQASLSPELPQPAPESGQVTGTETVLVCEDDEGVRRLTAEILSRAGYTVLSACDAQQAMDLARHFGGEIHLLVTDVIMPQMNGKQLFETLKERRPRLKELYVSGYSSNIIVNQGIPERTEHFLEKPFSQEKMLRKVREIIDSPAPAKQALGA